MKQLMFLDTIMVSNSMFCNLTSSNPFSTGKRLSSASPNLKNIKILIKYFDDDLMLMIASFLLTMIIIIIIYLLLICTCGENTKVWWISIYYLLSTNSLAWFLHNGMNIIFLFSLMETNIYQFFEWYQSEKASIKITRWQQSIKVTNVSLGEWLMDFLKYNYLAHNTLQITTLE